MEKLKELLEAIENATSLDEIKQIKKEYSFTEVAKQVNNISIAIYKKVEDLYLTESIKNKQKYLTPLNK